MPCYTPLVAWQTKEPCTASGKSRIIFSEPRKKDSWNFIQLPCGRCIGCRLEKSRQWALRCMQEASLYEENCFITLTFDDEHLDPKGSLRKEDFQKFMKRLRARFPDRKIRFFHCGEYGEENSRPHHHACLFGFDFPDKKKVFNKDIYTSDLLSELWPFGFNTIGDVTFESAAYVARYCCKKATDNGLKIGRDIFRKDKKTSEYITMSRRPGIAKDWYDKNKKDIYSSDSVVSRGVECKVPRYFDKHYELEEKEHLEKIKEKRVEKAKGNADNNYDRLPSREKVKLAQFKMLKREL